MDSKIAVVSGAGSGIGKAVSTMLAAANHTVVAADIDIEAARRAASECPERILPYQVDVGSPESVDALRDRVLAEVGTTGILVNSAGWDQSGKFLDATVEFAEKVVAVNYLGPVYMSLAFLPAMIAAGKGGKIVNISSDAARVGSSGEAIYSGAKGGVVSLTKSLAREMSRHGVHVNCVCPGPTDTPLFDAQDERFKQAIIKAIPFRRLAKPEEVAAVVSFFAGPESDYVTGQVISVSGGLTMAG